MTDKKHRHDDARPRHDEDAASETGAETPAAHAGAVTSDGGLEDDEGTVARLVAERDDYLDHLRRLQAEFENYRKRVRREADELRLRAGEDVVISLLPVVDNMARALEAAAQHEEGQLIAGLELVSGQLHEALAAHGLEEVPTALGDPFDPTVHEAVMTQPSGDHDEGDVLQVLERGYLLHGRLLRPARVVVAR
jgi:molecular chaperone GrpE